MTITEDPDTFLADLGVTVVCGAASGSGHLDMPDQVVGGLSISTEYSVLVRTSTFLAAATRGAAITVDGVAYTVKEAFKVDDGVFMRITLNKT